VFGEFDALAANDEGFWLVEQGQVDEGLSLLAQSARAGVPWALATYSWHQLAHGNPAAALDLAQSALPACREWIGLIQGDTDLAEAARYQLINARSNLALCGLAVGDDPVVALAVWEEGIEVDHVESAFYPAILAYRTGNSIAAKGAASAMAVPVLVGLRASFLSDPLDASSWFAQWCADGLAVLDLVGFTPPSVSSLDAERMLGLPQIKDTGELSAEDWETLQLVHQEDRHVTEEGLRRLAESGRAVSHPAMLELGTLLLEAGHLSPRYREGWDLLVASLNAPYRDVVAVAVWNISAELRRQGDEEGADGFSQLALELGDATALAYYIQAAQHAEDFDKARELSLRAEAMGTGSPAAEAARTVLALDTAARQDAHVRDWFQAAQGTLPAELVANETPIYAWRGNYNVDVASVAISPAYFADCEVSCYFNNVPGDCEDCGRVSDKFLYASSGAGDGGYSAFGLYSPSGSTLGVFTAFLDVMDGRPLVGGIADLGDWLDSSAPLFLGTIVSQGFLTLGDAAMTTDGRDVSVDFEVIPGSYAVVCWVGRSASGNELVPVALAAGAGPLGDVLGHESLRLPKSERDHLIASMWGAPGRLVNSLMADIRPQVLAHNYEVLKDPDPARARSYALQWAERDDGQEARSLAAELFGCGSSEALAALDLRGWLEPQLPWWQANMAHDSRDIWGRVLAARDQTVPLADQACTDEVWVRRAAARHPLLSAEQATLLAHDPDLRVRLNLALNPATPSGLLETLTESTDVAVASAAASSESCPAEVLVRLGRMGRCAPAVAANPNTPLDIIEALADSPSAAARASVAAREGVSISTLATLAGDADQMVRAGVAANKGIDGFTAKRLARDPEVWVRSLLASNPKMPAEVLAELTLDPDEGVRKSAAANPNASEESRAQASLVGTPPQPPAGHASSKGRASTSLSDFCSTCGGALVEGGRFCPDCGAPSQ
jgi:hypothetical protein